MLKTHNFDFKVAIMKLGPASIKPKQYLTILKIIPSFKGNNLCHEHTQLDDVFL